MNYSKSAKSHHSYSLGKRLTTHEMVLCDDRPRFKLGANAARSVVFETLRFALSDAHQFLRTKYGKLKVVSHQQFRYDSGN